MKLAQALLTIASRQPPRRRFLAGADAIQTVEQKIADLQAAIGSNRPLSTSVGSHVQPGAADAMINR